MQFRVLPLSSHFAPVSWLAREEQSSSLEHRGECTGRGTLSTTLASYVASYVARVRCDVSAAGGTRSCATSYVVLDHQKG